MRSKYKWIFTLLIALSMQFSFAQEKTVTGVVSDASGTLPGANVVVKGTAKGTQTDINGKYSIKAKQGDVLVFSFVGMSDMTAKVGASNVVSVKMQDGVKLENVVVNVGVFKKDANKLTSAVSTISGEEFVKQAPTLNLSQALQGKAAGVQVTATNSRPGANGYVSVRGAVNISGSSAGAVYVVDGVFTASSEASSISPQDIESVNVLKDGAAAAIYGIRGGNGVIVITTRKGKSGKTSFELNSSYGFSRKIKDNFTLMNGSQKIDYEQSVGDGTSVTSGYTPAQIEMLRSYNTNWEDVLLREGVLQNLSFSVVSGDSRSKHFLSVGYNKDTGVLKGLKGWSRISATYNTEVNVNKAIKFGANIRGSYEENSLPRDRYNAQNPFVSMYGNNGYETQYERDPNTGDFVLDANGNKQFALDHNGFNTYEAILNNTELDRYFRGYFRPYVDVKITENLTYSSKLGFNFQTNEYEYFMKPGSILDGYVGDPSAPGSKSDAVATNLDTQFTNLLNYKFDLSEKNHFNAILMYDYQKFHTRSVSNSRKGFRMGTDLPTSGTVPTAAGARRTEQVSFGAFGNLDYDFDNKYLVALYGRRDSSSLLGLNNQSAWAYGASLGWIVTKDFLKASSTLNYLKLRASYGTLNSTSNVGLYQNLDFIASSNYAGAAGSVVQGSTVANPDLKFEQAVKTDIGFESRWFKDRLGVTASYFNDKRGDFLYSDSTPNGPSWGITRNIGDWTAKGFEVELKGFIIKQKDLGLNLYVNAAQFDRKINALNAPFTDEIRRGFTSNKVGYSPDTFYMVRYAGVDKATGLAQYYDVNGAITTTYSASNAVLLEGKTPYAKYEGGFGLEFNCKGFDLNADFIFKEGNYSYNLRYADLLNDGVSINDNMVVEAADYWTPTNVNASQPAPIQFTGQDSNQTSDRFLQDASYVRFRNLSVGYTFDKKLFGDNVPLESVRIYAQAQNLYTWTKFKSDPEVGVGSGEQTSTIVPGQYAGYSYPTTKTFMFGLNVKF